MPGASLNVIQPQRSQQRIGPWLLPVFTPWQGSPFLSGATYGPQHNTAERGNLICLVGFKWSQWQTGYVTMFFRAVFYLSLIMQEISKKYWGQYGAIIIYGNSYWPSLLTWSTPVRRWQFIWKFPEIGVPLNHPISSILMIFSTMYHPFVGTPMNGNPNIAAFSTFQHRGWARSRLASLSFIMFHPQLPGTFGQSRYGQYRHVLIFMSLFLIMFFRLNPASQWKLIRNSPGGAGHILYAYMIMYRYRL